MRRNRPTNVDKNIFDIEIETALLLLLLLLLSNAVDLNVFINAAALIVHSFLHGTNENPHPARHCRASSVLRDT